MRDSPDCLFRRYVIYLIGFQKLRKNAADSLIDRDGAETSADDQDYWAIGRKDGRTGVPPDDPRAECSSRIGGTGQNRLIFRKIFKCFRKVAAYLGSDWNTDFICQSWGHIGFMDDDRHFIMLGSQNDRNSDKPPLEKTISGLYFFISLRASKYPFRTRSGSEKFLRSK